MTNILNIIPKNCKVLIERTDNILSNIIFTFHETTEHSETIGEGIVVVSVDDSVKVGDRVKFEVVRCEQVHIDEKIYYACKSEVAILGIVE